jgi:hypothetical protein
MSILPAAFLVRYRLPVARFDRLPRTGKKLLDLPAAARLAWPRALDAPTHAIDLRAGWNPQGIGFSLSVTGRTKPVLSDPENPPRLDALELWIDTRDTQTVHRATRYCHRLFVLPVGGGPQGTEAIVRPLPVARAREDAPLADEEEFLARSQLSAEGYVVEVWLPAHVLSGFDPATQPRLGFFCCIHDQEHGRIPFSVGEEFPVTSDPSLWHSLELVEAG